jgi:hypothetical protein
MRHFRSGEIKQSHRNSLDEHWRSKECARQQIESSRELIAASRKLLVELVPNAGQPQLRAMLTNAECRAFARVFKARAAEPEIPARRAAVMKNIAHSLSALASQLEMLTEITGK